MRLCVSTYSLSKWRAERGNSLEQSLDWIASSGVKAVEFAGLDVKAGAAPVKRARALRRRCERLGLSVAGYCVGAELLGSARHQQATVESLKREVEVAAELGVPSMRHDVTQGPGKNNSRRSLSFTQVVKSLVPSIRTVADHADRLGVVTSLENHGFYMQAAARVEKLIQAVDHPNFRLTLDLGNFLCVNDDPVQAVRRLARYAVIVHTKDFHVRPKKNQPVGNGELSSGWFATPTPIALRGAIVGHGDIDVQAQLRLLKKAGYRGFLSLEFEGIEDPLKGVSLGLAALRKWLAKSG